MGLFSRRFARRPADLWAIARGESDGRSLIVRWDRAAVRASPDAKRPVKVTIVVGYEADKDNDGLPCEADMDAFDRMEEVLFDELPKVADTAPVLVLTSDGTREWIAYAGAHEWLETWAPTFRERFCADRFFDINAAAEPSLETLLEWIPSQAT